MYCPRCAAKTADDTNFCNTCGLSLRPVADALASRPATSRQFDWSKTWLADMVLTEDERLLRRAAAESMETPGGATVAELKRAREVKAGIITSFSGLGGAIFLWFFLGAIAGLVEPRNPEAAIVLRHIWAVGVIPFLVGLGVILSAFLANPQVLRRGQAALSSIPARSDKHTTSELPALDAPPSVTSSVTEHTTELLEEPSLAPRHVRGGRSVET